MSDVVLHDERYKGVTMKSVFSQGVVPEELQAGLAAVAVDHKKRFANSAKAVKLNFTADATMGEGTYSCRSSSSGVEVRYGSRAAAFRAVGTLLAFKAEELAELNINETSPFPMRGVMIDCSRNGVLRPEAAAHFMRRIALMGVNMVMLYTEDTYEIPGEPLFGYLRGGYTQEEMRHLDDYADALGIELIPCIQTLGHMEQVLQWDPYFHLRDTPNVLLADSEPTYDFIRKMIRAASGSLRSKRIHIGMDEAHGLGTGNYRTKFGERPPFEIMNSHLKRVRDICREEGLRPMIWSDMYFRLGSKSHSYYDHEWSIPDHIIDEIPKDVQLVYWDYGCRTAEHFETFINFHRKLGSDPVMAGGIWTWMHLWTVLPGSFKAVESCVTACRRQGLQEVIMTLWGDQGMEVDIFSALPGIQYFCELAFGATDPMAAAKRNFAAVCGVAFDPWVRASDIDLIPYVKDHDHSSTNVGRSLLWQDPLLPVLDPMLRKTDLHTHYKRLAVDLFCAESSEGLARRLSYPAQVAQVLALKANLRRDLEVAYRANNMIGLRQIVDKVLPQLRQEFDSLWKFHRAMWMETYKPFGWEVIECRYGGVRARLATVSYLLRQYLAGKIESIPELEVDLHNSWPEFTKDVPPLDYIRVKTPSCIK
jgi:hypothetical protein